MLIQWELLIFIAIIFFDSTFCKTLKTALVVRQRTWNLKHFPHGGEGCIISWANFFRQFRQFWGWFSAVQHLFYLFELSWNSICRRATADSEPDAGNYSNPLRQSPRQCEDEFAAFLHLDDERVQLLLLLLLFAGCAKKQKPASKHRHAHAHTDGAQKYVLSKIHTAAFIDTRYEIARYKIQRLLSFSSVNCIHLFRLCV